jgi:hypothetical protein
MPAKFDVGHLHAGDGRRQGFRKQVRDWRWRLRGWSAALPDRVQREREQQYSYKHHDHQPSCAITQKSHVFFGIL